MDTRLDGLLEAAPWILPAVGLGIGVINWWRLRCARCGAPMDTIDEQVQDYGPYLVLLKTRRCSRCGDTKESYQPHSNWD